MKTKKLGAAVPSQSKIDRELACAAWELQRRSLPKKPPPFNFQQQSVPASVLALRADVKAGLW